MIYGLVAIAVFACGLALYEWRKRRKLRHDPISQNTLSTERAAHTRSERIRTEGVFLPGSSSGGH